jgi:hypothetical protein
MISFLFPLLARVGVPEPLRKAVAYASLAVAVLALLGLAKCTYDRSLIRNHDAEVTAETVKKDSAAKEQASEERANDTAIINQAEKDRNDAINKGPAVKPSPASIRHNCERLRRAGTDTTRIPQCN